MKDRKKALLCVAAGNIIFGFSFLFSRKVLYFTIPSVLLAARFTVAFIVLNVIALYCLLTKQEKGKLISFNLKGKPLKNVILLAVFQPCIYFICEGYGMVLTSTAFTGVVIAMIPIAGIVLDMSIMHADVSRKQVICAFVSVAGVIVTSLGASMKISAAGIVILFAAVMAAAFFYVFSKKSAESFNPLEQTYVMFGFGSALYIATALIQCKGQYDQLIFQAAGEPFFWIAACFLGIMSSVCAFMLINYGNRFIGVSESALLCNLTTVITILAGVFILGESFTVYQIAGTLLILLSVYFATTDKN